MPKSKKTDTADTGTAARESRHEMNTMFQALLPSIIAHAVFFVVLVAIFVWKEWRIEHGEPEDLEP